MGYAAGTIFIFLKHQRTSELRSRRVAPEVFKPLTQPLNNLLSLMVINILK